MGQRQPAEGTVDIPQLLQCILIILILLAVVSIPPVPGSLARKKVIGASTRISATLPPDTCQRQRQFWPGPL